MRFAHHKTRPAQPDFFVTPSSSEIFFRRFLWEFCLFDCQRALTTKPDRSAVAARAHRHSASPLSDDARAPYNGDPKPGSDSASEKSGGGEGIRTPDPMVANHVLCQLSYTPKQIAGCG